MKSVDNIYCSITKIENINNIYKTQVGRNTKNKKKLEQFEKHYVENICLIQELLKNKNYKVGKYNIFIITKPKIRLIMSQNITDKLINHVVCKYLLVDVFENSLIDSNIATRKGKGSSYGIKLLKRYIYEIKKENDCFYVLKFDIEKYFYNIDHKILKGIISDKIKDIYALKLLFQIIDSTDESYVNDRIKELKKFDKNNIVPLYNKGKGLPIGNMTSQFLAILYLNELDHMIKEQLTIKYYIRYMDDGIIIHPSKEYLKYCLEEITKCLDKYQLKLNNKTEIVPFKNGIIFLGYNFKLRNNKISVSIKSKNRRNIFKRINSGKNKLSDYNGYFLNQTRKQRLIISCLFDRMLLEKK